jgi:hypothetical protein
MARTEGPDLANTESLTDNIVRYRYPSFLLSNYGRIGPMDYTNLTKVNGAEDGGCISVISRLYNF